MSYKKYDCLRFKYRDALGLFVKEEESVYGDSCFCMWVNAFHSLNTPSDGRTCLSIEREFKKMELPGEFFT